VKSRVLSLAVVCAYVLLFHRLGPAIVITIVASCALPLACIWFSELIGEATGTFVQASPPFLVWFLGWITLLVPLFLKLVVLSVFG
jgi:hypothetical protein